MDIDFGAVCSHVMLWSGLYADSAFNDDVLHHHVVSEKNIVSFLFSLSLSDNKYVA